MGRGARVRVPVGRAPRHQAQDGRLCTRAGGGGSGVCEWGSRQSCPCPTSPGRATCSIWSGPEGLSSAGLPPTTDPAHQGGPAAQKKSRGQSRGPPEALAEASLSPPLAGWAKSADHGHPDLGSPEKEGHYLGNGEECGRCLGILEAGGEEGSRALNSSSSS